MSQAPSLFTRHRPIALAIANEYWLPGADQDDARQEALIALWDAARRYNPVAGASFPVFARLVIHRRLQDAVTAARARKHQQLSLAIREATDENDEHVPVLDLLADPDSDPALVAERRERVRAVLGALETLSGWERRCLVGVAAGVPYRELGEPKRVDNAVARARAKLRRAA